MPHALLGQPHALTPQLPPTLARVARANPVRPDDDLGLMPEAQAALDRILATEAPARRRSAARRSRRVVIVALATLLLVAVGAGLAATDPFGIFRNPNPGSALYGVDSSRHVKPPTAYWIQCPQTTGNAFRCGAALSGTRYELLDHIESNDASVLTRANLKTAIRQARARGEISAAMAKRFDQDLAAVSDTFLARFRTMFRYQQLGVGISSSPTSRRARSHRLRAGRAEPELSGPERRCQRRRGERDLHRPSRAELAGGATAAARQRLGARGRDPRRPADGGRDSP